MAISIPAGMTVVPSAVKTATTSNFVDLLGINKPEINDKLTARYGIQTLHDLVGAMGNYSPVAQKTFTHYEDDFIFSSFKAQTATVPTSGVAATTFTINATYLYDSKAFVRTGDIVMFADGEQRALVTATPAANTFTVEPYGAAWSFDAGNNATDIDVIVVGRESVGISQTPQDGLTPRVYEYSNSVMKIEDAIRVEGGAMTDKLWFQVESNGRTGWAWTLKSIGDTEKRFEAMCELQMLVGQQAANQAGSLDGYKGTRGLETDIKTNGQTQDLSGSTIVMNDIDDMLKSLNKYKGAKHNMLNVGIDLRADLDDLLGAQNKMASDGKNFGQFSDALAKKGIRMEFDFFQRLGYKIMLNTYDVFNHPELLGATGFSYSGSGFMTPLGSEKEKNTGSTKPYVGIRYKALDGYSRLREHWVTGGANGVYTNDLDENKFNYRTERGFEGFCLNKFVWISK